jgi:hypothetical protein
VPDEELGNLRTPQPVVSQHHFFTSPPAEGDSR